MSPTTRIEHERGRIHHLLCRVRDSIPQTRLFSEEWYLLNELKHDLTEQERGLHADYKWAGWTIYEGIDYPNRVMIHD